MSTTRHRQVNTWLTARPAWVDPASAVVLLGMATALMLLLREHLNVLNCTLIFLIVIVGIALYASPRVSIGVSVSAFLLFDFFFIPPYYTLTVAHPDHVLALFVFLGVAAVVTQLVSRVRVRTFEALQRGRQMATLHELSGSLIGDIALEPMLASIVDRVVAVMGVGACAILLPDAEAEHTLNIRASHGVVLDPDDAEVKAIAEWTFEHGQPSGIGAGVGRIVPTTHGVKPQHRRARERTPILFIPITAGLVIGVLGVRQHVERRRFTAEEQQLLSTFANQAALAIERLRLADEATRAAILVRSDELKSALLSAVSHDLRTPLASIKASATSLLQEDIAWSVEDRRDLLQAIDEETDRLTRIIGNLLDLSRIEGGVLRPQFDWNALDEAVAEAVSRTRSSAPDHVLRMQIADDLPLARFDYVEIVQVLINLIENAIKYSPAGTPIDIEIEAAATARAIQVGIADRGQGVPFGEETRVFEKFYRLSNRPGIAGAGIGLSICKGIVEAHAGRIWVEQRDGGGAVFRFTLPLEPSTENARRVAPAPNVVLAGVR